MRRWKVLQSLEPLEKFNFNVYLKNFKTSKKQFLA